MAAPSSCPGRQWPPIRPTPSFRSLNNPIYFGSASQPLFGMLHRPQGAARRTGIVLCASWGTEGLRSHRGLRQLAQTLSQSGFPVLRFDYRGTGDSGGDGRQIRLSHWLDDVREAVAVMRAETGAADLCLIGLRFGALLAQEAVASGIVHAQAVALWDSPPSGEVFVANLQQMDQAFNEKCAQRRKLESQLAAPARDELLGHDWPDGLGADIGRLPGLRKDLPGRVIFVSRDRIPPDSVESIRLPDAGHWSDVDRIHAPWLPVASFRIVTERLADGLP